MIDTPPGWFRQMRADWVHLRAPRDRPVGEFKYREYFGPLRSALQVVEAKLAINPMPSIRTLTVHPPQKLVTHEGEYAALVRIDAEVDTPRGWLPARRVIAIVFGDHFTTLLDGMSVQPALFDEFEAIAADLTIRTSLLLGIRRRRFVYAVPPGWQALANAWVTYWVPRDYPRNDARIIVPPATPQITDAENVLKDLKDEHQRRGGRVESVSEPKTIGSRHGLEGLAWRLEVHPHDKPPLLQELVVYRDPRYLYVLRLDLVASPASVGSPQVFRDLCASVEPIPDPQTIKAAARSQAVEIWVE